MDILTNVSWYFIVVLICISLKVGHVKASSHVSLGHLVSSLKKCLVRSYVQFLLLFYFILFIYFFWATCCCAVTQSCLILCDPVDCSMPGFPVLPHLSEHAQIHVHWFSDVISSSIVPFSSCLHSFPESGSLLRVISSHQVVKVMELQLQHQTFQRMFRVDFLQDWLVWSPCCPRDSQESSPTPQFKSINSLVLSLVYDPTLKSVHDYCKNHICDYTDLCWQVSCL